jgi:hypothetical protein
MKAKLSTLLLAAGAAIVTPAAVMAAPVTFNFGGNGGLASSYSFTSGGLTVNAIAGTYNGSTYDETADPNPRIGQYVGGLGVTNRSGDQHTVDNSGLIDYIRFTFSSSVQVKSIQLDCVGCDFQSTDADASYKLGAGTSGTWTSITYPGGAVNGFFQYDLNLTDADPVFRFGASRTATGSPDSFKVYAITVDTVTRVPEPPVTALLGAILLAFALRHRSLQPRD